jgi:hypothetical protein
MRPRESPPPPAGPTTAGERTTRPARSSASRFIAAERANHKVAVMCRVLGVSRSGFYAWERRAPCDRALEDAWLVEKIKRINADSNGTYGSRRIHAELRLAHAVCVSKKRVERLMAAERISGMVTRRRRRTTISVPGMRVADDLLERDSARPSRTAAGSPTSLTCRPGRGGSTWRR